MNKISAIFSNRKFPFRTDQPKTGRIDGHAETVREDPEATFAQRLRAETSQAHRIVESTNFVKGVLRGVMDLESFGNMQAGMYLVYDAMEAELIFCDLAILERRRQRLDRREPSHDGDAQILEAARHGSRAWRPGGAGLAGLYCALRLGRPSVVVTTEAPGGGGSSIWAQGGIAATHRNSRP